MNKELVISHYNKSIEWAPLFNGDVIVYTKGGGVNPEDSFYIARVSDICLDLPNIGREAHTYLYHIIRNYDNLSDLTIFAQDDAPGHNWNFIPNIVAKNDLSFSQYSDAPRKKIVWEGPLEGGEDFTDPNGPRRVLTLLGITPKAVTYTKPHALFAVSREAVLRIPKEKYVELIDLFENYPELAHHLEYCWHVIFDPNNQVASQ